MQSGLTKEFVRALTQANGLDLPDERLEPLVRQYESELRRLERLDTLNLPREAQPAPPASQRRPGGQEH